MYWPAGVDGSWPSAGGPRVGGHVPELASIGGSCSYLRGC